MDPKEKERLLQADRRYVWHPFTQMKDYAERDPILIEKAEASICSMRTATVITTPIRRGG